MQRNRLLIAPGLQGRPRTSGNPGNPEEWTPRGAKARPIHDAKLAALGAEERFASRRQKLLLSLTVAQAYGRCNYPTIRAKTGANGERGRMRGGRNGPGRAGMESVPQQRRLAAKRCAGPSRHRASRRLAPRPKRVCDGQGSSKAAARRLQRGTDRQGWRQPLPRGGHARRAQAGRR